MCSAAFRIFCAAISPSWMTASQFGGDAGNRRRKRAVRRLRLLRRANGGENKPQLRHKPLDIIPPRRIAVGMGRGWQRREHGTQRAQLAQDSAVAQLFRFAIRWFGPRAARLFDAKDFTRRGHSYTPRQSKIRHLMAGSRKECACPQRARRLPSA
jgi:hypothetical protein